MTVLNVPLDVPHMPCERLVKNSSDDEDDDDGPGGDDDQWGPKDDAVEEQHVEQPTPTGPRQSNREKSVRTYKIGSIDSL